MSKETVQSKGVSLYPNEWGIVKQVAMKYGISLAAALRHIVRNHQPEHVPQLPVVVDKAGGNHEFS